MRKVTDQKLLEQLNNPEFGQLDQDLKSQLEPITPYKEPSGALETFGKSAFRAPGEAIGNVMLKFGLTIPEIMNEALTGNKKGDEAHERGRMAHPIADILGGIAGFGPVGLGTSAGFRAIPKVAKAFEVASPSFLKRAALHGAEGATIGDIYSPPGREGEGALIGGIAGGALGGLGPLVPKALSRLKEHGKNISNIEVLGKQREEAQAAHERQQAIIDALKNDYKEQGSGLQTPEDITRKINEKQGKINELRPDTELKEEPTENLLNWPKGEDLVPNAMKEKNRTIEETAHSLGRGKENDVEAGKQLQRHVGATKQYIQEKLYKPVEEYTDQHHVKFPRNIKSTELDEGYRHLLKDPKFMEQPLFQKLQKQMGEIGAHDLIPATDYVKLWQETKAAANKANSLGWKEGGEDKAYWQQKSREFNEMKDKQLAVLKDHLPKEIYNKLEEASNLWGSEVAPFYGNKIYEQSKTTGKGRGRIDVPNIMHEVRGNERGQKKVMQTILSNPRLARAVVGHTYADNPEKLLNASEHEQLFINAVPGLKEQLERLKKHNFNIEVAKLHHEALKSAREKTEKKHKELIEEQKRREEAVKKTEKLKKEKKELSSKRKELKTQLEKGEITKEEFEKRDKVYADALRTKNSLLTNAQRAVIGGAAVLGIGGYVKRLLS